jgi:hypothetical protein
MRKRSFIIIPWPEKYCKMETEWIFFPNSLNFLVFMAQDVWIKDTHPDNFFVV